MTLDLAHLRTWIGNEEKLEDVVTPLPMAALSATLDRNDPPPCQGDPLPPLWHWLYFLQFTRASELGEDGHTARGGFLPRSRCRGGCGPAAASPSVSRCT